MKLLRKLLDKFADRVKDILLVLGLLLLAAMVLGLGDDGSGIMHNIVGLLAMSIACVWIFLFLVFCFRTPEQEVTIDVAIARPGTPGQRTWPHNIFDDNAYAVLGVSQDATRVQIREAFRALTQKHHPDAAPPEEKDRAAMVFVHIDKAYELLRDPEMRVRYDAWIEDRGGSEPPFEVALDMLRTPEGRAAFDAQINFRMPANKVTQAETPASPPRAPSVPIVAPPSSVASEEATTDVPAADVAMPEAVREALGLPVRKQDDVPQ
jgi:hypothetical protein